jgi:hypothetical protein
MVTVDNTQFTPRDRHGTRDHEQRTCLYCIDGWVFLSSISYDGEEIIESIRCRRC